MAKRALIQAGTTVACNPAIWNFFSGTVSKSPLKNACVPGLNCYSCPSAIGSCPLGALQVSLASGRLPFFAAGFLVVTGLLGGRAICGFLCPFGFFQEILAWISEKLKKLFNGKSDAEKLASLSANFSMSLPVRVLRLFKYFLLAVFVALLPIAAYLSKGFSSPYFCAYICPAGTLEAGIPLVIANEALRSAAGLLFSWKAALLAVFVVWSCFTFRPFCKYVCPLGAIYSFFNKSSYFGIQVDAAKCTGCGDCVASCKMNARAINSVECIRCEECASSCTHGAIYIRGLRKEKERQPAMFLYNDAR